MRRVRLHSRGNWDWSQVVGRQGGALLSYLWKFQSTTRPFLCLAPHIPAFPYSTLTPSQVSLQKGCSL